MQNKKENLELVISYSDSDVYENEISRYSDPCELQELINTMDSCGEDDLYIESTDEWISYGTLMERFDAQSGMDLWQFVESLGLKSEIEELVSEWVYGDSDLTYNAWEDTCSILDEIFDGVDIAIISTQAHLWNNRPDIGYKKIEKGYDVIHLVDTSDFSFELYAVNPKKGVELSYPNHKHYRLRLSHHDAPTGNYYDIQVFSYAELEKYLGKHVTKKALLSEGYNNVYQLSKKEIIEDIVNDEAILDMECTRKVLIKQ